LTEQTPGSQSRGVVDTAPLLERDFARLAGLGWFGKNTMLIHKKVGSFFLLASLLTTVELEIDQPHVSSHCGTCTACLDACPTQAFPEPGVLDASKCISYFTIELKGSIPAEHRSGIGDWAFGCDICQDVCPWNRKAPVGQTPELLSSSWQSGATKTLDLIALLQMPVEEFRQHFRSTALWRTKRQGLLRNACIVLGNQRDQRAIPALEKTRQDGDEVVREAAEWALVKLQEAKTGTDRLS
jgi:epoxyqueuosine reductase